MTHYRQVLDSDFEKLSGLITDEKNVNKSINEHAILGLNRLETENSKIAVTSTVTISCNENPSGAKAPKTPIIAEAGLEPARPYGQGILNP